MIGEGPIQSALRVVAASEVEVYHIHADAFLQHATEALIKWVCVYEVVVAVMEAVLVGDDDDVGGDVC